MVSLASSFIVPTLAFTPPTWLVGILVMLFVIVSGLVILTILIQRPQGGGLSGAFGSGAGSGQTAFGAKTGDALTIATIGMFALWVMFAVILNFVVRPSEAAPAAAAAATAPAEESAPANADEAAPAEKPAEGQGAQPAGEKPGADQPGAEAAPPAPVPAPPPPSPADSPEKKDPGSPNLPPK